jgi:hypothetical protein
VVGVTFFRVFPRKLVGPILMIMPMDNRVESRKVILPGGREWSAHVHAPLFSSRDSAWARLEISTAKVRDADNRR